MRRVFVAAAVVFVLLCTLPQSPRARPAPVPSSGRGASEWMPADSATPDLRQWLGRGLVPPLGELMSGVQVGNDVEGGAAAPHRTFAGAPMLPASSDSVYLLYPGACYERDAGTWAPRTYPVADSLNTYAVNSTGPYEQIDRTVPERLWHIVDASTNPAERPGILDGSRSLWCGKYNASWAFKVGYPNNVVEYLYIDTGPHSAPYTLSMLIEVCTELGYDWFYVIGGGGGAVDPLGNDKRIIETIFNTGHYGDADLLAAWSGSVATGGVIDVRQAPYIYGSLDAEPVPVSVSLTNVRAAHRAIYVVFAADVYYSNEDGGLAIGRGQVLDLIQTSDNGVVFDDQPQSIQPMPPFGPYTDAHGGEVLLGTGAAPIISSRVPDGVGAYWHLAPGSTLPTLDYCAPQKLSAADMILSPADATTSLTIPGSSCVIRTCPLPLPAGAYRVDFLSNAYVDFPNNGALDLMLRWYRDGQWSAWGASGAFRYYSGQVEAWKSYGIWTAEVYGADSIQAQLGIEAYQGASSSIYGALLDDIQFRVYAGTPRAQITGTYLPQSTFIDGTMTGTNCTVPPCWPGIYGTGSPSGIDDNVNVPSGADGGDRFWIRTSVGVRPNGMGINWREGLGYPVGGVEERYLNAAFNPAYDAPRMIYRLFDPATLSWSAFDSTVLLPRVQVSRADTVVSTSYLSDWPPPDKVETGASLPGGFTINGRSNYADLYYLPRGTRLQYYFKVVDLYGTAVYHFGRAGEVEDLPLLPHGSIRAPDIYEFDVLPRKYPPGAAGTLLAGRTDTPILNLDSNYLRSESLGAGSADPVTQALRALGVRADRYRFMNHPIGGHTIGAGDRYGDCWPNMEEYAILEFIANHYRIVINLENIILTTLLDEPSAKLIHNWWDNDTGGDGGDRCIYASGDDMFHSIVKRTPSNREGLGLMSDVFGVATVTGTWSGGGSNFYPTLDDRFSGGGPGLAAPNTFTYPLDGGCPNIRRFDGLTKIASSDAQNAVIFPSGAPDVAGISRMSEMDPMPDTDRNKALSHSFGIERIRAAGIPPAAPNYVHSGVENRMRVLYKFLTSCRGMRNGPSQCWPCPGSAADMTANWAAAAGFQTGTYGPLYPIQDFTAATPVDVARVPGWVNALGGNYPNPFNPQTVIRFTAASPGRVTIRVFDVAGRLVTTLVRPVGEAGPQEARWDGSASDGRSVSSGVYFYRIRFADGQEAASKMMILR